MIIWQQSLLGSTPWYRDSILAFDSANFVASGGFTDYNNVQMATASTAVSVVGSSPSKHNDVFAYGTGILMPKGATIGTVAGELANTILAEPFTFDYWYRELSTNTGRLSVTPINQLADLTVGGSSTWNNRLIVGGGIGTAGNAPTANLELWNNTQLPRVNGDFAHDLRSTFWRHAAFTYDGQALKFYNNGVLRGQLTWTILPLTGATQVGIMNYVSDIAGVIERYRLRTGVRFTSNFDPHASY